MGNALRSRQPTSLADGDPCPTSSPAPPSSPNPNPNSTPTPSLRLHRITKTRFNDDEKRVIRRYLPEFNAAKPSTRRDATIIHDHWTQLVQLAQPEATTPGDNNNSFQCSQVVTEQMGDRFYHFLFKLSPDLKPLFQNTTHRQSAALQNVVEGVLGLLASDDAVERAAQIAATHEDYGVRCDSFNPMGIALMLTLQSLAPHLWTSTVDKSWRTVYCHVALLIVVRLHEIHQRRETISLSTFGVSIVSARSCTRKQSDPSLTTVPAIVPSTNGSPRTGLTQHQPRRAELKHGPSKEDLLALVPVKSSSNLLRRPPSASLLEVAGGIPSNAVCPLHQ